MSVKLPAHALRFSGTLRGRPHMDNHPAVPAWGLAMMISLLLTGCTTVIVQSEGEVVIEHHLGMVQVVVGDQRTTGIALSSRGLTVLPGAFTLGWTEWKAVVVGQEDADRCLFVDFSPRPLLKE